MLKCLGLGVNHWSDRQTDRITTVACVLKRCQCQLVTSLFEVFEIRTERKLNQKVKSIFCSDSVRRTERKD